MSMERVMRLLQDLGLSSEEAEVYIFLAKRGPQTTNTLKISLKKNQEAVVRALKGLEEKKITTRKSKRSTFFQAIPFEKLLANYANIRFSQARRIEQARLSFLEEWKDTIKEKDQIEQ